MSATSKLLKGVYLLAALAGVKAMWGMDETGGRGAPDDGGSTPVNVGPMGWFGCGVDYQATKVIEANKNGGAVVSGVCRITGFSSSRIEYNH